MTNEELELSLRGEVAELRNAVTEALRLHPESDPIVTIITKKLDTTAGSPDQIEVLKRVQNNLRERKDALVKRHPDVEYLFRYTR
jgi:hypothetical protein